MSKLGDVNIIGEDNSVISTILAKLGAQLYVYVGLVLVIGLMWARIGYLKHDRNVLESELAVALNNMVVARQTNQINTIAVNELANKLEYCVSVNAKIKKEGEEAVKKFKDSLDKVKQSVKKNQNEVRKALQNETCAMVAIPSDVERVLRARTASANRDS